MWIHPRYRNNVDVADFLIMAAEEEAALSGLPLRFTQTRYIDGKPEHRDIPALLLLDKIKEQQRRLKDALDLQVNAAPGNAYSNIG